MILKKSVRLLAVFLLIFTYYPPPLFAGGRLFQAEDEIMEGLKLAYELKLDKAKAVFRKLEDDYSGSPFASFYPAVIEWAEAESYNRWRKVAILYSVTPPPKPNFPQSKRVIEKMEETISRAKAILKEKPNDFEAIFYLAGAYGFIARVEYVRGYYLPAIINGRRSAKKFDKLLTLYPRIGDAMLGPGVYRYFIGRLSPPMRAIVSLLGLKGSREDGLKLIKQAHKTGILSKIDSADFLALIYWKREKNIKEARNWIKRLREVAPNSILSGYHAVMASHSVGDILAEESALKELLILVENHRVPALKNWEPLLIFALASIKEKAGLRLDAVRLYNKMLKSNSLNNWLREEATLKLKSLKRVRRRLM